MNKRTVLGLAVIVVAGALMAAKPSGSAPSGEELWSMHCGRCHAPRVAEERSDEAWEVILMHMQVKAGLTKSEARAVAEYLKGLNDQGGG